MAALPPGFRRRALDTVASTNGEAFALARAGEASGVWVTAAEQSAGKGRRGRAWSTGRGNLAASLLLVDPAAPDVAPMLSFVAGVAVHQAVVDLAGPAFAQRLQLKWPNDLLLDRHKVAGILVEGEKLVSGGFAVVIGVGVNCVSHPDISGPIPAGNLLGGGVPVDAEALFERLALRMADEIARFDAGKGFAAIREGWLQRASGLGEPITVNLPERTVAGRFEALDERGRLILVRKDGAREAFSAGDVFLGSGAN